MVEWGLVCIATNYTHAGGLPIGSPGTPADAGASTANVLRARRLVDILGHLGYVDMSRVALHGHSMGAFVTAATAGAYPTLFRAASHTAGGMVPDSTVSVVAPTESQIAGIKAPYQMHHGDRDVVVPLVSDQLFAAALLLRGVSHDLIVYSGADHDDLSTNATVLNRVHDWYRKYGVL
jgi:dienelactone hydrolase